MPRIVITVDERWPLYEANQPRGPKDAGVTVDVPQLLFDEWCEVAARYAMLQAELHRLYHEGSEETK